MQFALWLACRRFAVKPMSLHTLDLDAVIHEFTNLQFLTLFIVRLVHQRIYIFTSYVKLICEKWADLQNGKYQPTI